MLSNTLKSYIQGPHQELWQITSHKILEVNAPKKPTSEKITSTIFDTVDGNNQKNNLSNHLHAMRLDAQHKVTVNLKQMTAV